MLEAEINKNKMRYGETYLLPFMMPFTSHIHSVKSQLQNLIYAQGVCVDSILVTDKHIFVQLG